MSLKHRNVKSNQYMSLLDYDTVTRNYAHVDKTSPTFAYREWASASAFEKYWHKIELETLQNKSNLFNTPTPLQFLHLFESNLSGEEKNFALALVGHSLFSLELKRMGVYPSVVAAAAVYLAKSRDDLTLWVTNSIKNDVNKKFSTFMRSKDERRADKTTRALYVREGSLAFADGYDAYVDNPRHTPVDENTFKKYAMGEVGPFVDVEPYVAGATYAKYNGRKPSVWSDGYFVLTGCDQGAVQGEVAHILLSTKEKMEVLFPEENIVAELFTDYYYSV
jgi:hypothetical protein